MNPKVLQKLLAAAQLLSNISERKLIISQSCAVCTGPVNLKMLVPTCKIANYSQDFVAVYQLMSLLNARRILRGCFKKNPKPQIMKSTTCTLITFPLPQQRPNLMVFRAYSNIYKLRFSGTIKV